MNQQLDYSADLSNILIGLVWTAWIVYTLYANVFQKRFSKFGLDAVLMRVVQIFAGKEKTDLIRNNPRAVRMMAFMMTLVCLGGVLDIMGLALEIMARRG